MKIAGGFVLMVALLAQAVPAAASERSATVVPAIGAISGCVAFAQPAVVRDMGALLGLSRYPASGGSLQVSGPDNPKVAGSAPESATISGARTSLSFSAATTPVDFAVVRSGLRIAIHYYPSGGVRSDSGLQVLVDGVAKPIDQINLCYGLGNVAVGPPPPVQTPIASCPVSGNCPNDGVRRLVCGISLGDQGTFSGGVTADNCCICNGAPLQACDPELPGEAPGSCLGAAGMTGPAEVPTTIELNEDPYVCTTSGGKRTCYAY